jgi:hypothetical protein
MSTRVQAEKLKRENRKQNVVIQQENKYQKGSQKRDENHPQSEKEKSKIVSAIEVAKKTPIIQPCFRRTNSIYPTNLYCPRQRIGSTSCS